MAEHLLTSSNARGFARMPELSGRNGETVTVIESSAASGPALWLNISVPTTPTDDGGVPTGPAVPVDVGAHLDAQTAWQLAEQLMALLTEHYQGDARPPVAQRFADLVRGEGS